VFDECQELRSGRGTSKGNAAAAFRARTDLAVFLSGTPIYNYGSEIFQIMDIVEPGALGTWAEFTTEWCTIGPGGKWIVENPQALGAYLRERHLMLRRTNDDVGNEFKPVNVVTHEIPHDAEVLAEDADLMRQLAQQVTSGTFVEKGQAAREFDNLLRHATGLSKAPHVAAFVKLLLDAGLPVVLFGWHRAVYDLWMEKLAAYNPVLFTGSETPRQKEKAKKLFTDGHTNLFIMSLRSGAGLDGLQHRAHTVVFGELDWSPQVHHQCTGRLHRPGQKNQVDAFYLVSDGGSDPTVVRILGLKASQSRGILDPLAGASEQHTDTTRIRALAEAYLSGAMTAAKPMPKIIEVKPDAPQIELFGVRT
jgi:SNF2 family DNA or RNA helicase